MKNTILMMAIGIVIRLLTKHAPEMIKDFWARLREKAQVYTEGTDTPVDDWIYNAIFVGGEDISKLADMVLDFGEEYILGTASKLDDAIFLPVFAMIREVGNIPDND